MTYWIRITCGRCVLYWTSFCLNFKSLPQWRVKSKFKLPVSCYVSGTLSPTLKNNFILKSFKWENFLHTAAIRGLLFGSRFIATKMETVIRIWWTMKKQHQFKASTAQQHQFWLPNVSYFWKPIRQLHTKKSTWQTNRKVPAVRWWRMQQTSMTTNYVLFNDMRYLTVQKFRLILLTKRMAAFGYDGKEPQKNQKFYPLAEYLNSFQLSVLWD